MTLNSIFEIANQHGAENYTFLGAEIERHKDGTIAGIPVITIDHLEKTIHISPYDWDWGLYGESSETITINDTKVYLLFRGKNNKSLSYRKD